VICVPVSGLDAHGSASSDVPLEIENGPESSAPVQVSWAPMMLPKASGSSRRHATVQAIVPFDFEIEAEVSSGPDVNWIDPEVAPTESTMA
jgi:hypothetical protein